MRYTVLKRDDLPRDGNTYEFEGAQYDDTDVSFIWVEMPPGDTVRLHQHRYKEIFIVQDGSATFTVDSTVLEVKVGDIVIVPAGVPHGFTNSGTTMLRQIDIHCTKVISTQWLEE
jgi:mannose-6-phosphate isomerase-like protein (cupin superfamily)